MTNECLPGRRDVVLVAHEPPNSEHLGIRLVAAGLAEAGFRPRVLPLATPSSLAAVVSETLAAQPFLVGVSISDPLVAPLLLAFVRLLRQRGFAGHITAGGALATLERGNLLAAHPAIDSVVRHAGEASIVELALALGEGRGLDDVPGLTTRLGEGSGNPHASAPSGGAAYAHRHSQGGCRGFAWLRWSLRVLRRFGAGTRPGQRTHIAGSRRPLPARQHPASGRRSGRRSGGALPRPLGARRAAR